MTTYLFPGQGSQKKGMGGVLFDTFPALTKKADTLLGYSIKALCLEDKNNKLNQTLYTQPALYVVNALSYQQKIKQMGEKPDFVTGHSLGEYNALQAAGAISFEGGLKLVKKRGELMRQATQGAMAAVLNLAEEDIKHCLEDNGFTGIDIANLNSPTQTVIAGLPAELETAQPVLEQAGAMFIPLNTSGAFHSRHMAPAKTKFETYVKKFKFADLQIPVISNVHAKPYQPDHIARNLAEQITYPVRWTESIQYLLDQGETNFEELGVGDVLTKLTADIQKYFVVTKKNKKLENVKTEQIGKSEKKVTPPIETPVDTDVTSVQATEADGKAEREREIEALHKRIADWNDTYPVGTQVSIKDYEDELETRTRAMILFGHRAAIYMKDYNGYFALDDVRPVADKLY